MPQFRSISNDDAREVIRRLKQVDHLTHEELCTLAKLEPQLRESKSFTDNLITAIGLLKLTPDEVLVKALQIVPIWELGHPTK